MQKDSDALDHFDKRSSNWNELYSRPQFRDRLGLFVNGLKSKLPSGKVLDYGCGGGVIACELAADGFETHGVDGAAGMIQQAGLLAEERDLSNATFEHIDPEQWQPEPGFDGMVCSSVIEYVEQDEALLKNLASGLKPGGVLLISIPTRPSLLGFAEDLVLSLRRSSDTNFANRRYRLREFNEMLDRAGMEFESVTHFEFPILGQFGVSLSRISWLGLMSLVVARKR